MYWQGIHLGWQSRYPIVHPHSQSVYTMVLTANEQNRSLRRPSLAAEGEVGPPLCSCCETLPLDSVLPQRVMYYVARSHTVKVIKMVG